MPSQYPFLDRLLEPHRVRRVFAVTAVVEAITWFALLIGMLFKHVLDVTELGVEIAGPLHGAAFVAYGLSSLAAWRVQRWSLPVGLLSLAASIPPLATIWFERWARSTGRLDPRPVTLPS